MGIFHKGFRETALGGGVALTGRRLDLVGWVIRSLLVWS